MELTQNEGLLRLLAFGAVFALLLFAQWRWPARGDGRPSRRQAVNLGMVLLGTAVLRFGFPVLAVGWAVVIHGGGLFGQLPWPAWLEFALAVLLLDLTLYWQHRLMHQVPLLWRLHRVHHCDTAFDVTTGVRFHPLEIALSMGLKLGVITLLGPHPAAVLAFEVLLSLGSLFTHTDIAFPRKLDRPVRWLFVTPSMHRIHHSTWRRETDSNYGFHLSVWDRLFRSYTAEPREDERRMPIGLEQWREPRDQGLVSLLLNPFRPAPRPGRPGAAAGEPDA
ncbi:sterol desaturase family protein [Thioalkalivibrio sp. XN8]|uniref:sterol desaturase family protein n=1 Tax=Thioalkalivibrio sp. XN8 TaxID=2712863 RepID=UPI0013EAF386|nr:sterol desaturase family protein [Thioalkalivibrio sp. XN8]NGP52360.1 sterol desaturase family protein [Thioalkalivibrio sp. XN8]